MSSFNSCFTPKLVLLSISFLLLTGQPLFSQSEFEKSVKLIETDFQTGKISSDEAILQKFYLGFDKIKLADKYQVNINSAGKCGSPIIREYIKNKGTFKNETVSTIENYLNRNKTASDTEYVYISPYGKFELKYTISGYDAVPDEDQDTSGVPDYVEKIASYLDYSWKFLVDTLGYKAPATVNGKMTVMFENSGYYGSAGPNAQYTACEIYLNNNFDNISDRNDDPEGYGTGSAKVTALHEFMHTIQYEYCQFRTPTWFDEMHATWSEDIGYDYVNDYYNFLNSSHINYPHKPLTEMMYEGCIFIHYLSEEYGVNMITEIWDDLEDIYNGVSVTSSQLLSIIDNKLIAYGASFRTALPGYFSQCYLCGDNVDESFPTFEEAATYPTSKPTEEINHLMNFRTVSSRSAASAEYLEFTSNGNEEVLGLDFNSDGNENTIILLTYFKNGSTDQRYIPVSGSINYDSGFNLADIESFTVIPVSTDFAGDSPYSLLTGAYQDAIFDHTPLVDTEDFSDRRVVLSLNSHSGTLNYDSLKLFYRYGKNNYSTLSLMSLGNNQYEGILNSVSLQDGDTVNYYFSVYDSVRKYNNYWPVNVPDSTLSFIWGTDNQPPEILHNAITNLTKHDIPRSVYCSLSDRFGIDSSYVEYSINGTEFQSYPMKPVSDKLYRAKVFSDPAIFMENDEVSYRIVAVDSSNNRNKSFYPDSGYINFSINNGFTYFNENPENKFVGIYGDVIRLYDTIEVKDDITINDLNVLVDVSGIKETSNFSMSLSTPDRYPYRLYNSLSQQSYDHITMIYDQEADISIEDFLTGNQTIASGHCLPNNNYFYEIVGTNAKGKWVLSITTDTSESDFSLNRWGLIIQSDDVISDVNELSIVKEFSLSQNYPNPFNPATTIEYQIPAPSTHLSAGSGGGLKAPTGRGDFAKVRLVIYDILGREVATLVDKQQKPGKYKVRFDASHLASGVYFYNIRYADKSISRKMILMK